MCVPSDSLADGRNFVLIGCLRCTNWGCVFGLVVVMAVGEGVDTVIRNCEEVCNNVIRNQDDCDVSWEGCNFFTSGV